MRNALNDLWRDPIRSRLSYDIAINLFIAAVLFAFGWFSMGTPYWELFLFVFLLIGFFSTFGLYGWFKTAELWVKATIVTLAALVSAGYLFLLHTPLPLIGMLVSFAAVFTFTPRFFFNLHGSIKSRQIFDTVIHHKMPVLVVGGAGYIGSAVVALLLKRGYRVRVLDTLLFGKEPLEEFTNHPHFELIEGDVSDLYRLTQALTGAQAVIHLAGIVGDPACAVDEKMTRHLNNSTTHMLKEAVKAFQIPRFIFASSCSVYGLTNKIVNEASSLHPVSLYAQTKIDAEKELLDDSSDVFHPTVLRFATVFGHSRRPRFDLIANLFTAQAFNEGVLTVHGKGQWRPFVHVNDLARAIVSVFESPIEKVGHQIFNVGDDRINITLDDLAELVREIVPKNKLGKKVTIRVNDKVNDRRSYRVSFKKIQQTLDFRCETDLRTGIQEIASHFKAKTYRHSYKNSIYSNAATIQKYLTQFYSDAYRKTHIMPMTSELSEATAMNVAQALSEEADHHVTPSLSPRVIRPSLAR